MFLRRIIIAPVMILLLVTLSGCSSPDLLKGDGEMTSGTILFDGYVTKIDISGVPATLNIIAEDRSEVAYMVDENLEEYLEITHQDGELRISTRDNIPIKSGRITIDIGAEALESIIADCAVKILGSGTFVTEDFILEMNGAGSAELELVARSMSAEIKGAADVTLSGMVDELRINGEGAVDIDTRDLIAYDAAVTLNGVGSVKVYAERTLDASGEGVGSITYWGDPELIGSTEGLMSIKKGD